MLCNDTGLSRQYYLSLTLQIMEKYTKYLKIWGDNLH